MFKAVLDTCVLWPSLQRDFLLTLATAGLYQPLWSEEILDELRRCEVIKLTSRGVSASVATQRASTLLLQMRSAFEGSMVADVGRWASAYGLPDSDDEHVVAAAELGGAGAIVTVNIKEFPARCLPDGVETKTPAEFAADVVDVQPAIALAAVHELLDRYKSPPMTVEEFLLTLDMRYGMCEAAAALRQLL